jgi:uncharacterized protein YdaU (DUF1376 family)
MRAAATGICSVAEFPALPLWTDALLGDTNHLTNAEFGAYMRLLCTAWRRADCALPNDDQFLGRVVNDTRHWASRLKPVVMAFWTLGADGMWRQKRLTRERAYVENLSNKQAANARKRWNSDPETPPVDNIEADLFGPVDEIENTTGNLPRPVVTNRAHDKGSDFIENKDLANATGYAKRMPPYPYPEESKNSSSVGGGPRTTIADPAERLARFQKSLAEALGNNGYSIVAAALDQSNPLHTRCLKLCKDQARKLGKGWPHQWPKV